MAQARRKLFEAQQFNASLIAGHAVALIAKLSTPQSAAQGCRSRNAYASSDRLGLEFGAVPAAAPTTVGKQWVRDSVHLSTKS